MIIDQLPTVSSPSLDDETVIEQETSLFKITWRRLKALLQAGVSSVNGQTGDVTVISDSSESATTTWSSQKIKAEITGAIIMVQTPFAIPAPGSSVSYDAPGMTEDHWLTTWNFSASAENNSPAALDWATYDGYFTITNNGGTTTETMQPIFEIPAAVAITVH